ncbi:MAG: hypothetical protein ACI311_06030 [Bacilli bacterium]
MEFNEIEKDFKKCAPTHKINSTSKQILDKYYNPEKNTFSSCQPMFTSSHRLRNRLLFAGLTCTVIAIGVSGLENGNDFVSTNLSSDVAISQELIKGGVNNETAFQVLSAASIITSKDKTISDSLTNNLGGLKYKKQVNYGDTNSNGQEYSNNPFMTYEQFEEVVDYYESFSEVASLMINNDLSLETSCYTSESGFYGFYKEEPYQFKMVIDSIDNDLNFIFSTYTFAEDENLLFIEGEIIISVEKEISYEVDGFIYSYIDNFNPNNFKEDDNLKDHDKWSQTDPNRPWDRYQDIDNANEYTMHLVVYQDETSFVEIYRDTEGPNNVYEYCIYQGKELIYELDIEFYTYHETTGFIAYIYDEEKEFIYQSTKIPNGKETIVVFSDVNNKKGSFVILENQGNKEYYYYFLNKNKLEYYKIIV